VTGFQSIDVDERTIPGEMSDSGDTCVGHGLGEKRFAVVSNNPWVSEE
jgi:transposase